MKLTTQIIVFKIASTIDMLFFMYAYAEFIYEVETKIYGRQSYED
jgi:hypothetical protein